MRKVSSAVMRAFLKGKACKVKATETDGQTVWLHRNRIAWKEDGKIFVTLAGWNTVTTRDRLNALCHLLEQKSRFSQRKFGPYFDGQECGSCDVFCLTE